MDRCQWSCVNDVGAPVPGLTPGSTGCGRVPKHLITTTVFRLPYGHQNTEVYAIGLLNVARTVARLLPDFTLRVYIDGSLIPAVPAGQLADSGTQSWTTTINTIKIMPHVQIVYVACAEFWDGARNGHRDLFGTMFRFLPMFTFQQKAAGAVGLAMPAWLQAPPDGGVCFSFEVDLPDSARELYLGVAKRYAEGKLPADFVSFTVPCGEADIVRANRPASLPSIFFAGLVMNNRRLPGEWLMQFWDDCKAAMEGRPQGQYIMDFKARVLAMRPSGDDPREMHKQTSPFIYGIDEFFLNTVLYKHMVDAPIKRRIVQISVAAIGTSIPLGDLGQIKNPAALSHPALQRIFQLTDTHLTDTGVVRPAPTALHELAARTKQYSEFRSTKLPTSWVLINQLCSGSMMDDVEYERRYRNLTTMVPDMLTLRKEGLLVDNDYHRNMLQCVLGRPQFKPVQVFAWDMGAGTATLVTVPNPAYEEFAKRANMCATVTSAPHRGPIEGLALEKQVKHGQQKNHKPPRRTPRHQMARPNRTRRARPTPRPAYHKTVRNHKTFRPQASKKKMPTIRRGGSAVHR